MACTDQGTFTVPSEFPLSVLLHVEHSFNPSCERAMSTNVLQYISNSAKVILQLIVFILSGCCGSIFVGTVRCNKHKFQCCTFSTFQNYF